jgi:hypothetical protein
VIWELTEREDIAMLNTTFTLDNKGTFAEEGVQRMAKALKEYR